MPDNEILNPSTIMQIKRSLGAGAPSNLRPGEFAYGSAETGNTGSTSSVLYIGGPTVDENGNSTSIYRIGGTRYTSKIEDVLEGVEKGTFTAGKALIVGTDGKIDQIVTNTVKGVETNGESVLVIGDPSAQDQKVVIHDPYFIKDVVDPETDQVTQEEVALDEYITELVQDGMITLVAGLGIQNITNNNGTYTIALTEMDLGFAEGENTKTFGSTTKIPQITVDKSGRITNVQEKLISTTLSVTDGAEQNPVNAPIDLINGGLTVGDGLALTATRAQEGQGDTDSANIAVDNTVVRTFGNQEIAGTKTFTTLPQYTYTGDNNTAVTETLATQEYIADQIGENVQAHSDQLDNLAALDDAGLIARAADGTIYAKTITNVTGDTSIDITDAGEDGFTLKLSNTGVTAGDYTKVTVDAQGRVTAGQNPTTLAGYGITDALQIAVDEDSVTQDYQGDAVITHRLKYASAINNEREFDDDTLVTKKYADNVAFGYSFHKAVRTGTEANVAGTYAAGADANYPGIGATFTTDITTLEGVTLAVGDRVMFVGQTDATQNGVYVVQSIENGQTVLVRAEDMDGHPQIAYRGASFLIADGANKGEVWRVANEGVINFGTDDISFIQAFAPTPLSAGAGITINGSTISLAEGDSVGVVGGKVEILTEVGNSGKALFTDATGKVVWKSVSTGDVLDGVMPLSKGGTGVANSDATPYEVTIGNIKLNGAQTGSDVNVPESGTLATLAGTETLTNKTVSAASAGGTALAVADGDVVASSYTVGEGANAQTVQPKIVGFVIDCGVY